MRCIPHSPAKIPRKVMEISRQGFPSLDPGRTVELRVRERRTQQLERQEFPGHQLWFPAKCTLSYQPAFRKVQEDPVHPAIGFQIRSLGMNSPLVRHKMCKQVKTSETMPSPLFSNPEECIATKIPDKVKMVMRRPRRTWSSPRLRDKGPTQDYLEWGLMVVAATHLFQISFKIIWHRL